MSTKTPADLPLRCLCGLLTGVVRAVTPANARRLSCLCDDCQSYALFLGRPELLDPYGGTDLSYATPDRVSLAETANLACVRLKPGGLLRWYASCCMTPIANTPASAKVAFVGIPHLAVPTTQRDLVLGPLVYRLQARFASAPPPRGAHRAQPFGLVASAYARIAWDSLIGRHTPSPFFDPASGTPVVTPSELTGPASTPGTE